MKRRAKALLVFAVAAGAAASAAAAPANAPTMCAKGDQAVFSCPLEGGTKTVSMCAAGDVKSGSGRFYYAYGRDAAKPELLYPKDGATGTFTRTYLHYAGGTGGFTYAFTNAGFKYVVYSVSGSHGQENQGLVVLKDGEETPVKSTKCQPGKVYATDDDAIRKATLQWGKDADISQHNIPLP